MAAVLQMKLSMARARLIYSNFTEPCSQGCSQQLIIGADNGLAPNEFGDKPVSETMMVQFTDAHVRHSASMC